jgi:hypothetical protein
MATNYDSLVKQPDAEDGFGSRLSRSASSHSGKGRRETLSRGQKLLNNISYYNFVNTET